MITVTGYRGEVKGGFQPRLSSTLAFAQDPQAAAQYAVTSKKRYNGKAVLLKATLEFSNPWELCYSLVDFKELMDIMPKSQVLTLLTRFQEHVQGTNAFERFLQESELSASSSSFDDLLKKWAQLPSFEEDGCLAVYPLLDSPEFCQALASFGFDGAIHPGNGATMDCLEYRIFGLGQILSLESTHLD